MGTGASVPSRAADKGMVARQGAGRRQLLYWVFAFVVTSAAVSLQRVTSTVLQRTTFSNTFALRRRTFGLIVR